MSAVLVDDDVNDEFVTFWRMCGRVGDHLEWHGRDEFADVARDRAWVIENGPLPEGWSVGSACGSEWCCAPGHLWLVRDQAVA